MVPVSLLNVLCVVNIDEVLRSILFRKEEVVFNFKLFDLVRASARFKIGNGVVVRRLMGTFLTHALLNHVKLEVQTRLWLLRSLEWNSCAPVFDEHTSAGATAYCLDHVYIGNYHFVVAVQDCLLRLGHGSESPLRNYDAVLTPVVLNTLGVCRHMFYLLEGELYYVDRMYSSCQ